MQEKQINHHINGKRVYTFDDHATAFEIWATERSNTQQPLRVISFDYHTDARSAFHMEFSQIPESENISYAEYAGEILNKFNYRNHETVVKVKSHLKHDEHIDAAIRTEIVDVAFVISRECTGTPSHQELFYLAQQQQCMLTKALGYVASEPTMPVRPYTYSVPANRIFLVEAKCPSECIKRPHDDDCFRISCDLAIEADYLIERLRNVEEMGVAVSKSNVLREPYILDIDLDYFQTEQSVNPHDPTQFHAIIQRASAITIALEPSCVRALRLNGENITSDFLLNQVMQHIRTATSTANIART